MGLLRGDGGTVSVEVELKNTIAEVKEKIQVKHKLPIEKQRLGLGWKKLQDEHTLEDYNIQQFSEIDLRLQLCSSELNATNTEENMTDKHEDDEEWLEIVKAARDKYEKDLQDKKDAYFALKNEKDKTLDSIIFVEKSIKEAAKYIDDDLMKKDYTEKEIETCREELERKKQEVRQLEKSIRKNVTTNVNLKASLNLKRAKQEVRRKEVLALNDHLQGIAMHMKDLISENVENRKLMEENQKMKEEKSSLSSFLSESIAKKESLLECPVCFNIASPPIFKCPSEHLICSRCLPSIKGKCPTCRTSIKGPEKKFRLAEEIFEELLKLRGKLGMD